MNLGPCVLNGPRVRFEPLRSSHREGLLAAAQAPEIWTWMSMNLRDPAELDIWMAKAWAEEEHGLCYPFVVIDQATGEVLGSTRYMDIHSADRGVEIGWTWYTPTVWGGSVNPEAKWLLLRHAFEDGKALRVVFRTDHENTHSQSAIRKLGAVYEGTLRNHRIRPDGSIRHTVVFSITPDGWPAVRAGLERRTAYIS